MTITVTDALSGPYTPNGVTTEFPFDFKAVSTAEVEVTLVDDLGAVTVVAPAGYSVALAVDGEGGTVTFDTAPVFDGRFLFIASEPSFEQDILFEDEGPFNSAILNPLADRAALRDIWLKGRVERSLKVPFGEGAPIFPSLTGQLNKLLSTTPAGVLAWIDRETGQRGPQGYVATSLGMLQAAPTNDAAVAWKQVDGVAWFDFRFGDYSTRIDNAVFVKSDFFSAGVGAWVRQGADTIAFNQGAPFVRTRSALEKLREAGASVKDTGAIGDGVTDDADAIDEIIAYFGQNGGRWSLPVGEFRTTRKHVIDITKPQIITGCGGRHVYPGVYVPGAEPGIAVIVADHADDAFEFVSTAHGQGSVIIRDLTLTTLNNATTDDPADFPKGAFVWDTNNDFNRNFGFEQCNIHGFETAFLTKKSGGTNTEVGLFRAQYCNINRNLWIARTADGTQWNGFFFLYNEAGQNGYLPGQGGIDISGHCVGIVGNAMEGMRDPIRVYGSMRGVDIRANYLEANVGVAAIHLQNIRGAYDIGPQAQLAINPAELDHLVLLTNCGYGKVQGPVWWDGVYKMDIPVLGNSSAGADNILNPNVGTGDHGLLRMDSFDNGNTYTRAPEFSAISKKRVTIGGRELAPWNGLPMPIEEYTTAGAGSLGLTYAIAGAIGDFVVMSWLFKREPGAGADADPYIAMSVNGTGAAGSKDYIANAFDENWRAGEWCLLTAAIKLEAAMTSLSVSLFPFGVNPVAGRKIRCLLPVVYTTNSPSKIIPYIDDFTARSVTATPNVPGFERGDILINGAVAAGGQAEFVKLEGADDNWVYA